MTKKKVNQFFWERPKKSRPQPNTGDQPGTGRTEIQIHISGHGAGPDGNSSQYAFTKITHRGVLTKVKRLDGLTKDAAACRGLLDALDDVHEFAKVHVFTDDTLVFEDFSEGRRFGLMSQVRDLIEECHFQVRVSWIPWEESLAALFI
jgi:hypothetical protein